MKKAVSDGYLFHWWRKAIRVVFQNRCVVCKQPEDYRCLECHHIIKRTHFITRWDWRNGVLVHTGDCHSYAASKKGEEELIARTNPYYEQLGNLELVTKKEYLQVEGMTENEFRQRTLKELKEKVGELIEV